MLYLLILELIAIYCINSIDDILLFLLIYFINVRQDIDKKVKDYSIPFEYHHVDINGNIIFGFFQNNIIIFFSIFFICLWRKYYGYLFFNKANLGCCFFKAILGVGMERYCWMVWVGRVLNRIVVDIWLLFSMEIVLKTVNVIDLKNSIVGQSQLPFPPSPYNSLYIIKLVLMAAAPQLHHQKRTLKEISKYTYIISKKKRNQQQQYNIYFHFNRGYDILQRQKLKCWVFLLLFYKHGGLTVGIFC